MMELVKLSRTSKSTLQSIVSDSGRFGITRIADITGLDIFGIPTVSCVCPGTTDDIWVYSGKGATDRQARISCVMECIERTSALWDEGLITHASFSELSASAVVWAPPRFTEISNFDPREVLPWILATRLGTSGHVWVPADLVFVGRRPLGAAASSFAATTSNGLAAAFTQRKAILHAVRELIERDVVSAFELRSSHFACAALLSAFRRLGRDNDHILKNMIDDTSHSITVVGDDLPPVVRKIRLSAKAHGLELVIKYFPNDFNVAVFAVAVAEDIGLGNTLGAAGYAASLDAKEALVAAALELAQSRATDRQGAREDCGRGDKGRLSEMPFGHGLLGPSRNRKTFTEISRKFRTTSNLTNYLARLGRVGLKDVAYYKFPRADGISVVRVICPGIETWHSTEGRSNLGPRMRHELLGS